MNVIKGDTAVNKYGAKGKNGVILIESKEKSGNNSYIKNESNVFAKNQISTDKLPEYKEGKNAFYHTMQQNVRYPLEARKNNIQGKVYVSFTVTKDGKIRDIEAGNEKYNLLEEIVVVGYPSNEKSDQTKKPDLSVLEDEMIRVIKLLDEFNPGTQDGKPVDMRVTVPVVFKLS